MSFVASAWASIACSGDRPFSKRPRRLAAQAEDLRRAVDVRADPVGGLHQHARRAVVDLGARAAHDAGDRRRALVVLDDEHLGVERADLVVERRDLLAVARAADREPVARDAVEVERVQRLAGSSIT